jgi:mRNA-degrading endonuclease toxin of MazEF toxin-antitoxin module
VRRGEVYAHSTFDRSFVVVSTGRLNEIGAVIVVEIAPEMPQGSLGMLAVALRPDDGLTGAALAWRVNYLNASRLGARLGALSAETMEVLDMALRTAMEL